MDIDRIAREASEALRESADRVDQPDIVTVRSSRSRRSRIGAAALGFAVTVIVVGVAVSLGSTDPTPPAALLQATPATTIDEGPPSADGGVTYTNEEFLYSVTLPSDWFRAESSLTPSLRDPFEILSLATFPLTPAERCDSFPRQAVVDFPGDGAFITLREKVNGIAEGEFVTRPARFEPGAPPYVLPGPEGDCLANTPRGDMHTVRWFPFKDGGRSLGLLVVIGSDVTAEVANETWAIVNSLIFEPRLPLDTPPALDGVFAGNVFVLDDGSGPVVCAGGVADSLPPQCGGPVLDGLDWAAIPWADSAQGETWAGMYIEVTLVEGRLVLAGSPDETRPETGDRVDFTPPCPAPTAGWSFTAGPGTSDDALNAAMAYVRSQPDQSGAWVYNLDESPSEFEPVELVLVATFTADVERHRAAISEIWSGPLCVAQRSWTEQPLRQIQDELVALNVTDWPPGVFLPSIFSVDIIRGAVEVHALIVTTEGQQWLDDRYGPGVVVATSTLKALPSSP